MNYLPIDDPKILEDLTRRKEFYQYYMPPEKVAIKHDTKQNDGWIQKYDLSDLKEPDVHLEPQSYQNFVANFLNPMTPYSRIILKWDPGLGKTIAAINVAMQFIRLFEKESQMEDQQIGSVFVIGFTEEIFKRELLSFPKYGFITREELHQKKNLEAQAQLENKTDLDRLQEFNTRLKKRLTSRKENGYFKFFGYKAFVNRIFMLQDFKRNINDMSEEEIKKSLKDGSLKWNKPLLDSFRNSIIICDEIHNVYNSLEKNNWGVALQMVLDYDPTIKAVYMSATPINNSPTEVIDLGNLMQPPNAKLRKDDFFDGKTLKKGALDRIAEVFRGRVSFVQDTDPRHFAKQTMVGEEIEGIPYLKFQRCPMSKFHYETYKKVYTGVLAQDAQYLMDIAFPNPQDPTLGLYKTNDIKRALSFATDEWFKKYGFKMQNDIIIGPGLYEDNIGQWSSKMYKVLKDIKADLTPHGGKILVYHDVVHVSGVLFIEQLLQHNGFISIDQNDTAGTLCAICGVVKKDHAEPAKPVTGAGGATHSQQNTKEWRIEAATDEMIPRLNALYRQIHEGVSDPDFDITPCNTRVMMVGSTPVAFITVADEGLNVARIDALVVSAEYQNMGTEEYLLEHYTPDDKILCVAAPMANQPLVDWWKEKGFQEHDRDADEGLVFLNYDSEANAKTGGGGSLKKSKPVNGKIKDHDYMPARYIVAHSDMDKSTMHKNIERFNSPDNTWGYHCRIIIGSKIIKESYNFKAIRKVKVTARPANTATLIQIFGRSRRKKAHLLLPPEYRDIEIKIYTTCLPDRDARGRYKLSHEEVKYREKVEDYQVIQNIERKMHEYAIDAVTARNIVLPGLDPKRPGLGALWFEPAQPIRRFTLKDLNLNTFQIFHAEDEVRMQIYIIKRLYIEHSLCYTFIQLWDLVKNPPFHVEMNTALFQKEYFVIALSMLVFGTQDGYVRPLTSQHDHSADRTYLLDILHSDIDKRIMQADRTIGYIHHMDKYYLFVPFRNGQHDIYTESPFRTFDLKVNKPINIMRYLKESTATMGYENQKLKFKSKYEKVPLEKLATVVGKFGVSFHQSFVEELIKYVFSLWTNPNITAKSEMHEFYFKMLYYYDLMGLIIWAATAKDFIKELYKPYLLPVSARDKVEETPEIHSIKMSLSRTHPGESIKISKTEFLETLKRSMTLLAERAKLGKKKKQPTMVVKADPKLLCIGHFMGNVPRFFHPDKDWFESPEYVQRTQDFKENEIIIGYYEKSGTGLRVKFKIRTPIHKIEKHKDIRMIEKGSICTSNSKEYLIEIAKKLKITIPDKINVPNLCQEIESRLQLNELQERKKKSNIKWFFSFWETQPNQRNLTTSIASSSPAH